MPNSRSNSLVFLLERTLRQVRAHLQQALNETHPSLTVDQWIVLQQVASSNGQNQRHLAETTAKDPASVTRILELLEKQKLVKRAADKKDLRSSLVSITAGGKKVLAHTTKHVAKFRRDAGKGLSQEELNLLKTVLDKLHENCGGQL